MDKVCIRCKELKKETAFKKIKCRNWGRSDTCRKCYDTNHLKEIKRTPEQIESQRKKLLGRKYSLNHRLAISNGLEKMVSEGRCHLKKNEFYHPHGNRNRLKYKIWKEKVLEMKGRKCEKCGKTNRLHIHHIKSYYYFPELVFEPTNGMILCISCHMRHHRIEGS